MSYRKILSRLTLASLVAAALAAPAATAMPADQTGGAYSAPPILPTTGSAPSDLPAYPTPRVAAKDPRQADMHASTVKPSESAQQDRRGESAADSSRPVTPPQYPGPPTWPENPQPIAPRAQAPLADGGDGSGGIDVPVLLLVIGGSLALAGGLGVTALRLRTRTAH